MVETSSKTEAVQLAGSERDEAGWFLTLWPLAILFHLAGNDRWLLAFDDPVGWLQLPMAVLATMLLLKRTTPWAVAVAISHIVVTIVKLPVVGNHEVFLLLISLSVLAAVIAQREKWLSAVIAPLRWVLLIGYGAIAFSKLNSAFLDPAVSCAAVFGDEFGRWVSLTISDSRPLTFAAIGLTLVVELSIPLLLLFRRSRRHGILLGLWFHTILALEPFGHVFDFTSVLFVLFFCFLTPAVALEVTDAIEWIRGKLGTRGIVALVTIMAVGNLGSHVLLNRGLRISDWLFDYPIFMVYAGLILQFVPAMILGQPSEQLRFRMHPLLVGVVLLAGLNAIAPYTEVRTSGAFNMYSNLAVINGESNHLLVGDTSFGRRQEMFVVVSAPDDSELAFYVDNRLLIPRNNLVAYANENPGDGAMVRSSADENSAGASVSDFVEDRNVFQRFAHRLFLRRAAQVDAPESCLRSWGPAN